jgi:hypothetical protein
VQDLLSLGWRKNLVIPVMEQSYSSLELHSWNEYKSFVDKLTENWAFRGQCNADWGLQNAIERTDFIHLYKGIEKDFLEEFQRGARNYLSKDETPEKLIEWLALMQHHGAPTRLLDLSKSPFIAAYFAFEECVASEKVAVWAINIRFLKERALEGLKKDLGDELNASNSFINESIFENIFYSNKYSLIFPIEPFRMNRRYSLQQSIFVSTGNSYEPFMQQLSFLQNDIGKAVIKIVLPSSLQKPVLRDLQKMNLHRASLFPDLDGYATSMRLRYNSIQTPEEWEQAEKEKLSDSDFPYLP